MGWGQGWEGVHRKILIFNGRGLTENQDIGIVAIT